MLLEKENKLRDAITTIVFDRLTSKKELTIEELTKDEVTLLIQSTCSDDLAMGGSLHSTDYLEDVDMALLNYQLVTQSISIVEYNNTINRATSAYYHRYILREFEDFMECDYVAPLDEDLH